MIPYCGKPAERQSCNGSGGSTIALSAEPPADEVETAFALLGETKGDADFDFSGCVEDGQDTDTDTDSSAPATNGESNGGSSAKEELGGCPDGKDPPPSCKTREDCVEMGAKNGGCDADDDACCCVWYTFKYCGVPSSCNPYLQCTDESAASASTVRTGTPTEEQKTNAFLLLMEMSPFAEAVNKCVTKSPTTSPPVGSDGMSAGGSLGVSSAAAAGAALVAAAVFVMV